MTDYHKNRKDKPENPKQHTDNAKQPGATPGNHSKETTSTVQLAAARYMRSGLSVIPVPPGEKNPNRPGWQREKWAVEDVPKLWDNDQGIGALWGEPSNGFVDLDCDWQEAAAVAPHIIPRTRSFGRASAPASHCVLRATGTIPKTKRYKMPGERDDATVVELLSTGAQSLLPPSLHPSGEAREWHDERPAVEVSGEECSAIAADVATAALLVRNWPGKGARHDFVLAAAGFLGRHLPRERTERVMEAAILASGDEEEIARRRDVQDTLDALEDGRPTTGGPTLDQLAPGVVEMLQRWHGWGRRGSPENTFSLVPEQSDEALPSIVVNDRQLREVGAEAMDALLAANVPPTLFARSGAVIRLGKDENDAPIIQEVSESMMRHHLARAANFVRIQKRKTSVEEIQTPPPREVVQDVLSVPHLPFPPLIGVPRTPFFRPDGTIVTEPGYDASTRLYYVPAHESFAVDVPHEPSEDDLKAAVTLLDEMVGDFPYVDCSSAASALALLLTPILRNVIAGPVPMALIDKPTPGTGGSLLAEVVSLVATGRPAGMMSAPRDDEEVRKSITAALMLGNLVVTLDNVEGVLNAPSLSRALTSEFWEDRILGRSEITRLPQRATWITSGNNIQVGGDLPRRCYRIRLDARVERPWERREFRHPNLKAWITEHRARLVGALLTLGRAWFGKGKPVPDDTPVIGGFEEWSRTVGGVLAVAGIQGFLDNLAELYERSADGSSDWAAFLQAWRDTYGEDALTTKQVAQDLHDSEHAALRDALPEEFGTIVPDRPDKGLTRKLGKAFAKREGRRHGTDGLHLKRTGQKQRTTLWSVTPSTPGDGESVSLVSLVSFPRPNLHARAHAYAYARTGTNSRNTQNSLLAKMPSRTDTR